MAPARLALRVGFYSPIDFVPKEGVKYGLLRYRGEGNSSLMGATDCALVEIMSPGKAKLAEGDVRLCYGLRKLDAAGLDVIVSESVSETGIGVAMMDRLRRAATGSK